MLAEAEVGELGKPKLFQKETSRQSGRAEYRVRIGNTRSLGSPCPASRVIEVCIPSSDEQNHSSTSQQSCKPWLFRPKLAQSFTRLRKAGFHPASCRAAFPEFYT